MVQSVDAKVYGLKMNKIIIKLNASKEKFVLKKKNFWIMKQENALQLKHAMEKYLIIYAIKIVKI